MRSLILAAALVAAFLVAASVDVSAQPSPAPALTGTGGWAGFVDDGRVDHGVVGGGAEWVLARHVAVGPEVLYMIGPGDDRDLFVLGVGRIGILPFGRRVVPFLTLGAGTMTHADRFGGRTFRSTEGAFVLGGGARIEVSPRVFVAPEFTVGWEPHARASVNVGIRLQ